ncbi:hypothetical protein [Pontibacter chinhatensis]|uniref:Uncharacterized protein n=1 Tax=Pontibacter chinhatensis TaxID=1436961 RepID=A0A1I2ZNJ2_9BACT|nr:hypothetical protein [Pontibacter chinhatensis]SFH39270.1 hypothetical protein SAMN05421739_11626 [Pontibacter chinhatensis]
MRKIRLVTYQPLCYTLLGIEAIQTKGLPPFIDASCRREPDFEGVFPSISALCRKNKLAPQLRQGDIVVYLTKPGKFQCSRPYLRQDEYKLTGILEVVDTFKDHVAAGMWFDANGYALPSNCLVAGNAPKRLFETGGDFKSQRELKAFLAMEQEKQSRVADTRVRAWDRQYQQRAVEFPSFVVTRPVYLDLNNPISLFRAELVSWFGNVPGTQASKILTENEYQLILEKAKPTTVKK